MKRHTAIFCVILLLGMNSLSAKNYFIAPAGNDTTGNGTISAPYRTIMKAQLTVVAGDTIFARGGTYKMSEAQIYKKESIWAYINYLDKSGTSATKRICYWAYPGEQPIFDLSAVKPANYRNTVFYTTGSWLHFKGLEVIGVQVTITTHTQSECFRNEGSNNIFEQLRLHDGMGIGFYLTKGSNNLVLNCDAYRNYDPISDNGSGGNNDGFGIHPPSGGTGNVVRGCRAWLDSDDGYDTINAAESVTFDNCWAFYNGFDVNMVKRGNGNGFKVGGYGQAPVVSSLPSVLPSHLVKKCLSYANRANGFYANHHVVAGTRWYNNTAYKNSTNYNMLSQQITKSSLTGNDTTLDCAGINHILHNNISFKYSSSYDDTANIGTSNISYNTFTSGIGVTVDASDFLSLDESLLYTTRAADGSMPVVNFLRLKPTSDLIDKGMDVGFAFSGSAPDFGAFEYQSPNGIPEIESNQLNYYPNPVKDMLTLTHPTGTIEIVDLEGRSCYFGLSQPELNLSFLRKGVYLMKQVQNNHMTVSKLIKN